jgi:hypothetical protein
MFERAFAAAVECLQKLPATLGAQEKAQGQRITVLHEPAENQMGEVAQEKASKIHIPKERPQGLRDELMVFRQVVVFHFARPGIVY